MDAGERIRISLTATDTEPEFIDFDAEGGGMAARCGILIACLFTTLPVRCVLAQDMAVDSTISRLVTPQAGQDPRRAQPPQTPTSAPPAAGRGTAAVQAQGAPQIPSTLEPEPRDWAWVRKMSVALVVLLAALVKTVKVRDRRRLASLRVVPHQHPGRPHVVIATSARHKATDD